MIQALAKICWMVPQRNAQREHDNSKHRGHDQGEQLRVECAGRSNTSQSPACEIQTKLAEMQDSISSDILVRNFILDYTNLERYFEWIVDNDRLAGLGTKGKRTVRQRTNSKRTGNALRKDLHVREWKIIVEIEDFRKPRN